MPYLFWNLQMSTRLVERMLHAAARSLASKSQRLLSKAQHLERRRVRNRNAGNPNALLVWIPKTAGTSLNNLLTKAGGQTLLSIAEARRYFRNRGIVTFGHISVPHLREAGIISDEFYKSALKFAFVRNPFDRAVSLFEYSRLIGKIPGSMGFPTFCQMLKDHAYEDIGDYNHLGLSQLNPQTRWLIGGKGELCVDFVGRFERYEDDVQVVLRRLNLSIENGGIPHVNRSQRMATESYYGDADVEAVQHAYRCDFEAFGYSFIPRWKLERASRAA
jgi:hypothetical protein